MRANKVIVIGGGAAGMMAAGTAASLGADVTLIEKNSRTGRKILITGKGRCNITNYCDIETFIRNIPTNPRFLYSAYNNFSTYDAIAFFEELGVPTKIERGNRVFPVSDSAKDIADAMYKFVVSNGCKVQNGTVTSLIIEDNKIKGVKTSDGKETLADKVIIACGGASYKATGSTGDGYKFARACGHTVTKLKPSLVPLESKESFCKELQGTSLKNISVTVIDNFLKKRVYSDFGEMLFTHFGVSGPVILSSSSHMSDIIDGKYTISIDLKPALDFETLDKRLVRDLTKFANKDMINSLNELLPKKLIPVALSRAKIDQRIKCNSLTHEKRIELVKLLKNFTVTISDFRPIDEAIVTSGGVSVKEINPKTMESKLIDGLYFAGEVIDVDGYTGGFNLQIAFSTGRLSGQSAAVK